MSIPKVIMSAIVIALLVWGGLVFDNGWNKATLQKTTEKITIKSGEGSDLISQKLSDKKLINNQTLFQLKLSSSGAVIIPGIYTIESDTPAQIITQLKKQSKSIAENEKNRVVRATKTVTIPEGKTVDEIADILQKNGVGNMVTWKQYVTTRQAELSYEFLPSPLPCQYGNIKSCVKYYYEGYLYPNTYDFFMDATPREITQKFLDGFEQKVPRTSSPDFAKQIIVASIVERETGRPGGITDENRALLAQERALVAGVVYNRLQNGTKIQSDPTVAYGLGKQICQQGRTITGCIFLDDPLVAGSKYDTYEIAGLPIGPITTPQLDCITAAQNPAESDFLYFVADISGKKYFAKTNAEHEANIAKVSKINQELAK